MRIYLAGTPGIQNRERVDPINYKAFAKLLGY